MDINSEIVANFCLGVELGKRTIKRSGLWYSTTAITAMTYGLLTLLLNFRVYTVLLKNRKMKEFSSTFYTVFIIASVVVRIPEIFNGVISLFNFVINIFKFVISRL